MKHQLKCEHSVFHESCTECQALQAEYYKKLKAENFNEIEDVTHPDRLLKSWHSFKFGMMDPSQRDDSATYYHIAAELLHTYPFEKPVHKFIWSLHCEGLSKREIEEKVASSDFEKKYKRESILNLIKRIAREIIR